MVSPWEDVLARWLFLLEGSENEEILKTLEEIAMQDPVLNQAMDEWEKSSDDPKIREEYYDRRKAVLDEMAAVREAELRLREAIRQSKKEGREEGREEEKKKVTKKLLKKGMDFKSISDITGMSEEEIKNLR
nr:Rpn family recombination-promoting nuclease/putative transposase [Desulfosporosinus lacus]